MAADGIFLANLVFLVAMGVCVLTTVFLILFVLFTK